MDRKVLFFEDLRGSEFVHADKLKGFDVDHMTLSLKWLAKWHATTAVLLEQVTFNLASQNSIEMRNVFCYLLVIVFA